MKALVEYLAIFRRVDSFCDSPEGFTKLLQVDSNIRVNGGVIHYNNEQVCSFAISGDAVAGTDQRYFHLRFTWEGDPTSNDEVFAPFLTLLKAVRVVIGKTGGETETLHDDISAYYAKRAYPLIYDIENVMRRLIATFMLTTVGREWVAETLPQAVEVAVKKSKRQGDDYINVLHRMDFSHLIEILVTPYSKRSSSELYGKLLSATSTDDLAQLREFVPQSNWKRYFSTIVSCEDSFLKKRWDALYELRCKVAHCGACTLDDFKEIEKLVQEVKPRLDEAIAKLATVRVPRDEIENVAENAARSMNTTVGEFITAWQRFETAVVLTTSGTDRRLRPSGDRLSKRFFSSKDKKEYDHVRRIRNAVVHGPTPDIPIEEIARCATVLHRLSGRIEALSGVRDVSKISAEELSELEKIIDNTTHKIVEVQEFCDAIADTNASGWVVDEFTINGIDAGDGDRIVHLSFSASGKPDEERMHFGSKIVGSAEATVDGHGDVTYRNVVVEVVYENGEYE